MLEEVVARVHAESISASHQGERGERGESPRQSINSPGRNGGGNGQILGEAERLPLCKLAEKRLALPPGGFAEYPTDALGDLAGAARALTADGQVLAEIAGQCVLSSAALLAQSKANVQTLAGVKPLCLYALTLAESGEGKSTADDVTQMAIVSRQRAQAKQYTLELTEYEASKATRKKNEFFPKPPKEPYRIMRDGTVEGIRRAFKQGVPSQGVFSSEAAMMLAGYGMSEEQRAKSAGNFNSLWDCGEISVARGLDGRIQLYDRRLSIHWLVQPAVAMAALHDPLLSAIGFWPRCLLAFPAPAAPLRALPFNPSDSPAIRDFWNRCEALMEDELPEDCAGLPVLCPDRAALSLASKFFERMQEGSKTAGGPLVDVKPFAIRAPEQAFRIAGVLSVFAGKDVIDFETMRSGIRLAAYSLEGWRYIFGEREHATARNDALLLFSWLLKQRGAMASNSAILRIGPKRLRSKDARDTALALLEQEELVGLRAGYVFVVGVAL